MGYLQNKAVSRMAKKSQQNNRVNCFIKMFIKRKIRVEKANAYWMHLSFKTSVTF